MLPNQMFNAVLSSLRTFDPLSDTLDILIISFVFYQLLQFARKSRAGQLVKGIILILVFYGLAVMLNLKTVTWVLNNVITIGFMAAVVIFQPELRRTLERMGQSTMWANLLVGNRRSDPPYNPPRTGSRTSRQSPLRAATRPWPPRHCSIPRG